MQKMLNFFAYELKTVRPLQASQCHTYLTYLLSHSRTSESSTLLQKACITSQSEL
eukprot:c41566_g1_i1 orf=79-243(+)